MQLDESRQHIVVRPALQPVVQDESGGGTSGESGGANAFLYIGIGVLILIGVGLVLRARSRKAEDES